MHIQVMAVAQQTPRELATHIPKSDKSDFHYDALPAFGTRKLGHGRDMSLLKTTNCQALTDLRTMSQ